jgi:hypothetical protein
MFAVLFSLIVAFARSLKRGVFMLIFNILRVLKLRDIERPYSYLVKNGFPHTTAINFANGNVAAPKIEYIERLCRLLICTPNDLYEWTPETGKHAVAETHPLNTLSREKRSGLNNLIKAIPLEKLSEVEEFLERMKDEVKG